MKHARWRTFSLGWHLESRRQEVLLGAALDTGARDHSTILAILMISRQKLQEPEEIREPVSEALSHHL